MPASLISPCKICSFPDRARVDQGLLSGQATQNQVADLVGCDRRTVYRHIKNHLAMELVISGEGKRSELLAELTSLKEKTTKILNDAMKEKNYELALKAIARREAQAKLTAEICGELQEKKPNELASARKAQQLEAAIDSAMARAHESGLKDVTPNQIITGLLEIEPELKDYLAMTKYASFEAKKEVIH